jgi:hypothetical protein
MRCPSGILFSRCLFVTLNTVLLLAWAVQLAQEDEENVRIEREIQWWDREIERLEGLLERRKMEVGFPPFFFLTTGGIRNANYGR